MEAPLGCLPEGKMEVALKKTLDYFLESFVNYRNRQRPIFPGGYPPSIVGARSLYDRVRDGNGWCPSALSPINLLVTYTGSCIMINLITFFLSPVSLCLPMLNASPSRAHILRLIRKFWQKTNFAQNFSH